MKTIKFLYILPLALLISISCEQELITLEPPVIEEPVTSGTPGSANFTKFVAIGNSFVAGVQGGALFTEGQNNSLPAIMAEQFKATGVGGGAFVQADIKASLGWNLFITQPFLADNSKPILGRMLLQGASPKPTPQAYAVGNIEALPSPVNSNFLYGGGKATLNNFGVPAIVLGQSLIKETGAWAGAGADPRFSPFYGRLAYPGTGTSTIIGDAAAAGGSFFMFYLGLDDFFLYAAFGGDPTKAPLTPASGAGAGGFDVQYGSALGALLGSNANLKGVVGNFPNIFKMPHFTSVVYNPIPFDAATATAVSSGFAGYNAALDGLVANAAAFGISAALVTEIGTRKVTFSAASNNKALLIDETLTDLGPYFDGLKGVGAITTEQRAALTPYQQVRQTTASDILPLSTGSILGTTVGGNPLLVNGVSVPLADQYVLIPSEIAAINNARIAYNATVQAVVSANTDRLALADIDAALEGLIAAKAGVYNSVTITPNINPPTGIYSEDGVHPNSRGYAFLSRVFIQAINTKFGATIPLTDLSKYKATALPIP
jgi:lysophospholipase L1-like esterase